MNKFFLLFLSFPSLLMAEVTYITIPGEGWHIKIESPTLTATNGKTEGRIFRYSASSVKTGVTLSVSTELKGVASNKECFDTYWSKTQTNPTLKKGSEVRFKNEVAYFVSHRSEGEYKGMSFKTANAQSRSQFNCDSYWMIHATG